MTTGQIAPSSGDALIYGSSVNSDMAAVRALMGLCPQHDILYDELTAKEHLVLFGTIKGLSAAEVNEQMGFLLQHVNLTNVAHKLSRTFSGGMKRRLSVAISLVGNPKVSRRLAAARLGAAP
jgi:ABC-type multidrug transport system ATPase subunit